MTTLRQIEANRLNGCRSQGPRTDEGKAIASRNSLRHGATASAHVLPGLEREEDWLEHVEGIHDALAPLGTLETMLVDRVAACAWRLGRVVRYENAMTANALETVDEDKRLREGDEYFSKRLPSLIAKAESDAKLNRSEAETYETEAADTEKFLSVPDAEAVSGYRAYAMLAILGWKVDSKSFGVDHLAKVGITPKEIRSWDGWTAALIWEAAAYAAEVLRFGEQPRDRIARLVRRDRKAAADKRTLAEGKEAEAARLRIELEALRKRVVRERILPDDATLQRVARHESHLTRQMTQALHELQRLQAAHQGQAAAVPFAVDLTIGGKE